jgi:hypothetical protein
MKAHRRNGIPTLMLQDGGGSLISRFFNPNPAQRKAREQQRMGLRSILLAKPTPLTNIDQQSYDIITEAIRPLQSFYQQSESGSASRGMSPTDYAKSLADSYVNLGEYISGSQVGTGLRRSNADPNPVLQVGPQFAANLQERIGAEINRVNPVEPVSDSMYEFSVQEALLRSAQDSAARAEADALRQATGAPTRAEEAAATATTPAATATTPAGTATTPAETATTPAETAATSAETAATPAATVAPEGPEKEALRQATGAPTQAEEAAATAATPTGTAAEQPIAIEPDDSVAGTLNSILLGDGAKFDEEERLKQLKKTFGLNLSDMERSAPALAFSFALMGATKEPGESPLQAFIRNAGAAGQSALAQQQALDAKQRSLDAALISPILTERRAAETIERDKEWVTYWDGTTGDGLPNFKSTKMNARQIEEAQKAGIELVPLGLAGNYIAQSAVVQRATKDAEGKLGKAIFDRRKDIAAAIQGTVREAEGRKVRDVTGRVDGSPTTMTFNADPAGRFNNTSAGLSSTSTSMEKVDDMIKAVDQGALNAVGTFNYVIEGAKDYVFGGVGSNINETVSTLRSVGKVSGDLAWNGDNDEEVKSQLKRAMGKGYDQDLSAEQNFRKFFNEKAVFANVTEEDLDRLKGEVKAAKTQEERSLYQARIDYLVNQRSLAASLAPLLLGESGRTISDGDRIRVIELMGGFASGLKVTKPQEASTTLRELKSILGRNAEKLVASLESEVLELETASKTPLYLGTKNEMVFNMTPPVAESLKKAQDALRIYRQIFGQSGGSSADQNAPPSVYAGTASNLKTVK